MKLIYSLCMSIMSLFACASSGNVKPDDEGITDAMWDKVAEIQYSFGDSSVPPEYHRSYYLTITKTEATISITSYGTELFRETYKVTPNQWKKMIAALKKLNITHWEVNAEPCDGGQSEYVAFRSADKSEEPIFTGSQDTCGNSNMNVDFEAIPRALGVVFPKTIEEIVDTTREQANNSYDEDEEEI